VTLSIRNLQYVHRRDNEGLELLKMQWRLFPALTIKHSTLGNDAGLGLFARKDLRLEEDIGILCVFFGKIIVATEEEVSFVNVLANIKQAVHLIQFFFNLLNMQVHNHQQNQHLFLNLRKNLIQYPQHYNPIVPPPGQHSPHHVFLLGSDACMASYANTNTRQLCNAEIFELTPKPTPRNGHWMTTDAFESLEQWKVVMKAPILCLRLIKNVTKGEEIFAYYQLPRGVPKLRVSANAPKSPLQTQTQSHFLSGSIALEGDDTVSAISRSPTDDRSDYSGGEYTDSTNPTSPNTSPPFQPTAPLQQCPPLYSPDLDASEFTSHLSLCVPCHCDDIILLNFNVTDVLQLLLICVKLLAQQSNTQVIKCSTPLVRFYQTDPPPPPPPSLFFTAFILKS
jgi:hypothetical protein